jgi:ferredoxin
MKWDDEAVNRHECIPVPPSVSPFARKQAEKCAKRKGLNTVTLQEVQEAETAYADYYGREKTMEMRNLMEGKEPVPMMVDELFFDPSEMLYDIQVCPVKYGSQSRKVTEEIVSIYRGIKEIFERENLEEIIAGLSRIPLSQQSRFCVVITGCSNCCEPPFFRDIGIIGQHVPEITDGECRGCEKCTWVCFEDAITLEADGPRINRDRCINCEFCAKTCPSGKIIIGKKGYKVIAGGSDYRHPAIAETVKSFTDRNGVLDTVEKAVTLLKKGNEGDSMKTLIEKHGVEVLV